MVALALNGGAPTRRRSFPPWPRYGRAELRGLRGVLRSRQWGTLGPRVAEFERAFASYLGADHCCAVTNGTTSLELILRALDVGPGDEVIVPPYTFIATATAVLSVGAVPVFADVDPATNNLSPAAAEEAVTGRTKAIIPVHIAGVPADMDALVEIGNRTGLPIVEDAAQAHGSEWRNRKLGTIGAAGSFGFQLSKNLSAGEGGAVVTNDPALAARMRSMHHVGRREDGGWYEHHEPGGNYRMTDWQASVLIAQLGRLDRQIAVRERNASVLDAGLREIDGISPFERDARATRVTRHLYMARYDARSFGGLPKERFVAALEAEGIPASTGYVEIQRQPVFAHPSVRRITGNRDYAAAHLPAAERACRETFWIMQNALLGRESDIRDIVTAVRKIRDHYRELL